jgi:prepilin-type N-terminal cleavage/methylation domain-containing protein
MGEGPRARSRRPGRAFTLVELLVVVALLAILAGLLLPGLAGAKHATRRTVCLSNLRQVGVAIHVYASDFNDAIPFGPKALPFTSPGDFYPSTGAPTALISARNGVPVGLGLLLAGYLGSEPSILFCPGTDQKVDARAELEKVGSSQAVGSYFYRHAGVTSLFDPPDLVLSSPRLGSLGSNREGLPISGLAIDSHFLVPPGLEAFNVKTRSHHQQKVANVLHKDGRAETRSNRDARFTVNVRNYGEIRQAFERILEVIERADAPR